MDHVLVPDLARKTAIAPREPTPSTPRWAPEGCGDFCAGDSIVSSEPQWEARPGRRERSLDLAFAATAMVAAVMRFATAPAADRWLPAIVGMSAINGLIAILFLIRRPVVAVGTLPELASCLPTMVGFALALRLAPEVGRWPWHAHGIFVAGTLMTVAAFVSLGSSFGVLPALRRIVEQGPYRLVRHPAYAGELIMAAACFSARPSMLAASAWLLLLPGVMWRILSEERVLSGDEAHADYRRRVRWRLVPFLW